ncbi:kinase-like domain-containing protein [Rhizophagus clarus]|uniref:Kinase-like domain-containing protein n=1 Tax=Rhizophagus clarus TaxID=94130 RepID=A0A8H3MC66_9GLOM|nr:kinase-like domain-containing protein [Rhizophagus clarus]
MILRYIYGGRLSLEDFFNLNSKEYLHKVYPYKKIIPKDLRENLFKHFLDQPNNNSEPKTTKEIDSIATKQENLSAEKDFSIIVDEINDFIYKLLNKGIDRKFEKQKVIEYFNDHTILIHWKFIIASENYNEALNLFTCALAQDYKLAQYFIAECYRFGHGITRNEKLAFEHYEKAANKSILSANDGNMMSMYNLGICYINGKGVKKDYNKAFELFKQSAEGGCPGGIRMLACCFDRGIGTKIDKQKAFELYQNAANLGDDLEQYNLTSMYEKLRRYK